MSQPPAKKQPVNPSTGYPWDVVPVDAEEPHLPPGYVRSGGTISTPRVEQQYVARDPSTPPYTQSNR